MRCPECDKRNSVAAKQCIQCSAVLKAKPIPLRLKLYAGFAVGLLLLIAIGVAVMSHVAQSEVSLSTAVKALATKTTSPEESTALFVTLDHALENFLKHHSGLSRDELIKTLQSELPATGFEVHVFDLPQKLKLVEVDFGLTVYDYLLYASMEGTKVAAVSGLGVFEDGAVIHDLAQPTLVLLGHAVDGTAHKPCVKAYSLLLDRTVDETDKLVPKLDTPVQTSDGTIKFADNRKDIVLPLIASTSVRRSKNGRHKVATVTKSSAILVWGNGQYSFNSANKLPEPAPQVAHEGKPADATQTQPESPPTQIAAQAPPVQPAVVPPTVPKTGDNDVTEPAESTSKHSKDTQVAKSNKTQTEVSQAASAPSSRELGNGSVVAESGSVKMRRGPGTSNSIVTEISGGTPVQVIGRNDSWYKVRANGQEGYVYAGLIDYDQKNAYTTATVKRNARIVDDRHRFVETASAGDRVVVLRATRHAKYKIQLANGKVGYLDKDAIDQTATPTAVASAPPTSSRSRSAVASAPVSSHAPASSEETPPPLVP